MFVHLGWPYNLGLQVSQDVLFDCQLDHLSYFTHRAIAYAIWATNFEELGAAVSTTRNHSQVTALQSWVLTVFEIFKSQLTVRILALILILGWNLVSLRCITLAKVVLKEWDNELVKLLIHGAVILNIDPLPRLFVLHVNGLNDSCWGGPTCWAPRVILALLLNHNFKSRWCITLLIITSHNCAILHSCRVLIWLRCCTGWWSMVYIISV